MMLQLNSLIVIGFVLQSQALCFKGFKQIKTYLRKPCSFDSVTLGSKLIPKNVSILNKTNWKIYTL